MESKKSIVLVDDHVLVRAGLKELIAKLGPYTVVAEFSSGDEFLSALPFKKEVDLILLDLSMPGKTGDEVVEVLSLRGFKIPIMILTLNSDDATIIKLFRNGVRGYLRKDCGAATFKLALEEIFRCGYYHNEFLTMSLLENPEKKKTEQEKILDALTVREKEFLKLVCHEKEYTYEQIAEAMTVQHRTVDGYRESIFEKFRIKSKTGLVLFVLKHKLFELL